MTYVHFEINGMSLDLDDLDRCNAHVESAGLGAMVLTFHEKLDGLRCPTHEKRAIVHVYGPSLSQLDVRVSGCCDEFVEVARTKL